VTEFERWKRDVRLALDVYGYIRRSTKWTLDTNINRFELEWHSGPVKTDMRRIAEHKARMIATNHSRGDMAHEIARRALEPK
jgi:hypothetical protein